jgi:hypothetical protein
MKNKNWCYIFTVLSALFFSNDVFSQNNTTYSFLNLDAGARASALAGSFSSNTNDVMSIFYNPAALSTLNKSQVNAGFYKYLLDINAGNAAYGQKLKNSGYIGAGIRYINYGSFDKFDEQSNNLGTFSANELALSLGYSNVYSKNFHYGINMKFIYSGIDEFTSTGLAADIGLLYLIPSTQWNFGLSLLNAGFQLSEYNTTKEDLPVDLRVAVSKKLEHLPLNIHFEFDNLVSYEENFFDRFKNLSIGGEFDLSDYVQFRLGYDNSLRQDLKTGSSLGIAGFSAGFGIKFLESYSLDYSFNSMGNVGSTQSFNIGYNWK